MPRGFPEHGRQIGRTPLDRSVVMADRLQTAVEDRFWQSAGHTEGPELQRNARSFSRIGAGRPRCDR